MDELEHGLDLEDSAFQAASEVAGEVAYLAKQKALGALAKKLGLDELKKQIILYGLALFGVIICACLLYGASQYVAEAIEDTWNTFLYGREGVIQDDFVRNYSNQAEQILDAINTGRVPFGNDMMMLSKEDFIQILEAVIQYNEDVAYATTPERIRYEYEVERYEEDNATTDLTGEVAYTWVKHDEHNFKTVSYQDYGDETDVYGENVFAVPWQTIFVLCEMMAEDNYEKFGSDEENWKSSYADTYESDFSFETSMDGYFVTSEQVKAICELVNYHYDTVKIEDGKDYVELTKELIENGEIDYGNNPPRDEQGNILPSSDIWGLSYSKYDMERNTYSLENRVEDDLKITDAKVPEIAMKNITNFYHVVNYVYEPSPNQAAYYCTQRTSTIDAKRFMNMVTQPIPSFTFKHFFELLEMLPGTESEIRKYKEIEQLYNQGEETRLQYEQDPQSIQPAEGMTLQETLDAAYQKTITLSGDTFTGYHYYIGGGSNPLSSLGTSYTGEDSVWIGSHVETGATLNDWFPVQQGARVCLNGTDGLSKEQIKEILLHIAFSHDENSSTDGNNMTLMYLWGDKMAEALYNWQNQNDASVTAILAIMQQESGFDADNENVNLRWNFVGWNTDYDFKQEAQGATQEEKFINAIIRQASLITNNYIKAGQDTFYKMQFNQFENITPSQEGYLEQERHITHAYCPWWEDGAFPTIIQRNTKGWCNNTADIRSTYLGVVGLSVDTTWKWPVPDYTRVSSEFGLRESPTEGASTNHKGMDIAAPQGTPIYAASSGIVRNDTSVYSSSAGYWIGIETDVAGFTTDMTATHKVWHDYMHMVEPSTYRAGDYVEKGAIIGYVGSTGVSTGPHLHFQIKEISFTNAEGTFVNPRLYVQEPFGRTPSSGNTSSLVFPLAQGSYTYNRNGASIGYLNPMKVEGFTACTDLYAPMDATILSKYIGFAEEPPKVNEVTLKATTPSGKELLIIYSNIWNIAANPGDTVKAGDYIAGAEIGDTLYITMIRYSGRTMEFYDALAYAKGSPLEDCQIATSTGLFDAEELKAMFLQEPNTEQRPSSIANNITVGNTTVSGGTNSSSGSSNQNTNTNSSGNTQSGANNSSSTSGNSSTGSSTGNTHADNILSSHFNKKEEDTSSSFTPPSLEEFKNNQNSGISITIEPPRK